MAERIRRAIEADRPATDQGSMCITVSLGTATITDAENGQVDDMIRRADENLYRAKRLGRNRVCADADGAD